MEYKILIALQSIKKKDSSLFRTLLFSEYRKKHWLSHIFYLAYAKPFLRPAIVFLLIIYSFRKMISTSFNQKENSNQIYIYNYANEKKSILHNFPGSENACELTYAYSLQNTIRLLKSVWAYRFDYFQIQRFIKLCMRLSKRNSFLVTARQIEFLVLYTFFKILFRKYSFKEVYISSESNPEVISAALACVGARINYTNHGFLNKDLGIFFHDRLFLDSKPLKDRILPYLWKSSVDIQIINKTQNSFISPNVNTKKILILGSLIFDVTLFRNLIRECQKNLADSQITVRFHPNKTFFDPQLFKLCKTLGISVKSNKSLKEELSESTLVIAGETSAHLDALAQGVPSVYYRVDHFPQDHYGFISSQLIPEMKSLDDLKNSVQKFYSDPKWLKVYKNYFEE